METKRFLSHLFVMIWIIGFVTSSCEGYKFYVGGKDGWVVKPSESYDHWAERNRFQVNDTLYFRYINNGTGSYSVLVVSKDDYYSCNTKNPIRSLLLTDGEDSSIFRFDRSGYFFFISGNSDHCNKGQKLIILVMAVRHKTSRSPPAAASPPPVKLPKAASDTPATSTPVEPPQSKDQSQVNTDAPAPAPSTAGSSSLGRSRGLVLAIFVGLSVFNMGSF